MNGIRTAMIILLVLVLMIVTFNPMSRQQISTEAQTTSTFEIGDEVIITEAQRFQVAPRIWNDTIVWTDYRNGNFDIYTYNLSSEQTSGIAQTTYGEFNSDVYENYVVMERQAITGRDLVIYNMTDHSETVIDGGSLWYMFPVVYGDTVVFMYNTILAGGGYLTNYTISNGHLEDLGTYHQFGFNLQGDSLACFDPLGSPSFSIVDVPSETETNVETVSDLASLSCDIYGNNYFYITDEAVKMYDKSTGVTSVILNGSVDDDTPIAVWGEYVVFPTHQTGNDAINVINYVTDEYHSFVTDYDQIATYEHDGARNRGIDIHDGKIVYSAGDTIEDMNIYMVEITDVETPTAPPTGDGEELEDFVADNWIWIVGVILLIVGLLFVEGYYAKWEHIKKMGNWFGLIISAIVIIGILAWWYIGF